MTNHDKGAYIFLVVSETLWDTISITGDGQGPSEPYALCELVSADTREQARWAVYQTWQWYDQNDASQMPKFRTAKIRANYEGVPCGIVSDIIDMETAVPARVWNRLAARASNG